MKIFYCHASSSWFVVHPWLLWEVADTPVWCQRVKKQIERFKQFVLAFWNLKEPGIFDYFIYLFMYSFVEHSRDQHAIFNSDGCPVNFEAGLGDNPAYLLLWISQCYSGSGAVILSGSDSGAEEGNNNLYSSGWHRGPLVMEDGTLNIGRDVECHAVIWAYWVMIKPRRWLVCTERFTGVDICSGAVQVRVLGWLLILI